VHSDVSRPQNIDELFFMLVLCQYGFDNKRVGTRYAELVLLHPVGSMGRVVHFGASGSRNVDELFFMLGRTVTNSTKGTLGHVTPNLSFCIYFDLRVTRAFRCVCATKQKVHCDSKIDWLCGTRNGRSTISVRMRKVHCDSKVDWLCTRKKP
jgi:hypothetical protein